MVCGWVIAGALQFTEWLISNLIHSLATVVDFKHDALIIKSIADTELLQIHVWCIMLQGTRWRSWLKHCAGLSPEGVTGICH
jgi:hypothetical protein